MTSRKRSQLFTVMVLASLALILASDVPGVLLVGRVLILFSTLFHELGHALAAMLVGGHLETLNIYWDGSGVAHTWRPEGRLRSAFISAGGLVGPALAAAALFWAARGREQRLRRFCYGLGIALIGIGAWAARSVWSLVFTIGLGLLLTWAAQRWRRSELEAASVFLAVQLGLSVFTRGDYLFTRWAGPNSPSDVAHMESALFLPFWFWGLVCGALSLVVLWWGFRCYTRDS